ncbi:MAG: stage II sporulation protein M [Pseudomonadota bacterium]
MRQQYFKERHAQEWDEMEAFVRALENRYVELPFPASEFPGRYRRLCQHLAVARARGYSRGLQDWLHELVLRAHQRFYGERHSALRAAGRFLLRDYPRLVRAEWRYLLAAFALFMAPLLLLTLIIPNHPEIAYTILSPGDARQMEAMYDPALSDRVGRERESEDDFVMFAFYVRNNTSIGFQTFVGGLLFGAGTVFYLLFNGLYIGAIAGHLTGLGFIDTFWGFVAGHSSFELTAIMLSGAAGLKLGAALLAPGSRTRRKALRDAMAVAVQLMYGAAALFLAAAFVEAYWSSIAWLPATTKYIVGIAGWALVAGYILIPGRNRAA